MIIINPLDRLVNTFNLCEALRKRKKGSLSRGGGGGHYHVFFSRYVHLIIHSSENMRSFKKHALWV